MIAELLRTAGTLPRVILIGCILARARRDRGRWRIVFRISGRAAQLGVEAIDSCSIDRVA